MSHCSESDRCPFYTAVEASIVKRIRFASMYPYCNGGKAAACSIRAELLQANEPAADLLPDGTRGDYCGETSSNAVSASARSSSRERFVVVEDSPIFASFAANSVRFSHPDAEVIECHTFAEAESALRSGPVKLIISGFGLDGGRTVHDVRRLCDAPIVLLTGRPDRDVSGLERVHMVEKGAGSEAMRSAIGALLGA